MTDETTTEQLADIEGQAESTPAAEYTPPEGWRVVRFGEQLLPGDVWVNEDGTEQRSNILHWDASAVSGGRCIRRIKPEPQSQPESDTELQAQVAFLKGREVTLGTRLQQEREVTTRLRGEMETVQNQLGESRQRVTQLEELVTSLRTINEGAEKAVSGAGVVNDSLRLQLAAVKAELATKAETSRRLQMELDAAQQVPADSPELRQLRADLAEVTQDRDTYRHAHELLVQDVNATHARTKAMTVEAIAEWLVPVQAAIAAADNVAESTRAGWLAEEVIQHLPKIMRSLVGLDSHAID